MICCYISFYSGAKIQKEIIKQHSFNSFNSPLTLISCFIFGGERENG